MATGDVQGNLDRLRVQLRTIAYPHPLDLQWLKEGNPAAILPLLHYALLGYSRHVCRYLSENGYELFAKSDLRFVECTLKYLREEFGYRCPLTVAQIFSRGFAERKFIFVHDVIQFCKRKHNELIKLARQAQPNKKMKGDHEIPEAAKIINVANIDSIRMNEIIAHALRKGKDKERAKSNGRPAINASKSNISIVTSDEINSQKDSTKKSNPSNQQFEEPFHQTKSGLSDIPKCQKLNKDEISIPNNSCEALCTEILQPVGHDTLCEENHGHVSGFRCDSSILERTNAPDPPCETDQALNRCYKSLRQQIVEVADNLEKRLLALEGDARKMTTNLQSKIVFLERQMHILEQMQLIGKQASPGYENFQINERMYPLRSHEKYQKFHLPAIHSIRDISNIHQPIVKTSGSNMDLGIPLPKHPSSLHQQERLSTQELIACVKARCNKTKEFLMDVGWPSA
eukprot:c23823_g1_i2 orf=366-1736(-)